METNGIEFNQALKQAQKLGYAEADPSSDIDGMDTLYKIRLAIAVGLNTWVDQESILLEGIRHIQSQDVLEIKKLGYRVRLIAKGEKQKKHLHMSVEPTLVKEGSAEANILQNYNIAVITPERGNLVYLSGQGAGGEPTATNVLRDLFYTRAGQREMLPELTTHKPAKNEELQAKYFIRLSKDLSINSEWIDQKWYVEDKQYFLT
jgi:homoserine dehydrogenase